ncbi:MAG TPA: lysophospholipid acyltransferase family protein [Acidimicrobiia bacterium]|jgi:1-acyl-sn-glycerol-3-phosphate acyltransferase
MWKTLVAAVRTAISVPLFLVFTIALAGIVVVVAIVKRDTPLIDRIIRWWSRSFLFVGGVDLEIEGRDRIDPAGQYVFVANHLSNFDIPVMFLTAPVPIRYLAKKEVYRIPLVSTAMHHIGMVKVDRQAGSSVHTTVNEGVAAAKARGHSLIIFPEGTRSDEGMLQPFKKGAFRIAIANQLTVVPVTISGTWEVWAPGRKVIFPGAVRSVVHEPIPTAGLTLADLDTVRDRAQAVIAATYAAARLTAP